MPPASRANGARLQDTRGNQRHINGVVSKNKYIIILVLEG